MAGGAQPFPAIRRPDFQLRLAPTPLVQPVHGGQGEGQQSRSPGVTRGFDLELGSQPLPDADCYGLIRRKNFAGPLGSETNRFGSVRLTGDHWIGAVRLVADCRVKPA